jgi:dTDP-4-dehydrorhamnose reductase
VRILVLGASGEVGRLLLSAFPGHEVRGVRRPEMDLLDASSIERVIGAFDPEAVILAAGLADPDFCEDHPGDAYAVNVDGARRAAEAARGRHFTHFSTDHVFDGKAGPYAEDDRPDPINVYGRTKLESERIVRTVHPKSLVVRTSLVFAPSGRSFFARLLSARAPVPCWTDQFGTPTYGPNLAEAVAELVLSGRTGVLHLAGTDWMDRHAFALRVARRFGLDPGLFRPVSIREAPPRAPRPLRAGLRTDRARSELRTKLLSVDEALELAYRSYGRSPEGNS